jgi:hypothetical protein
MAEPRPPEAKTHLPGPIERRLLKPYAGSALGRVASGGVARALSVLIRKHPRAVLHAVAAGIAVAGRIGWDETRSKATTLLGVERQEEEEQPSDTSSDRPKREAHELSDDQAEKAASPELEKAELGQAALVRNRHLPQRTAHAALGLGSPAYPPELVEATRREFEAELDAEELERARRLLDAAERRERH